AVSIVCRNEAVGGNRMKRLILRVSVTAIILSGLAAGASLFTQSDIQFSEKPVGTDIQIAERPVGT
ncbi:PhrK family phosphatase-inhibitory pheromone, partial [Bacillus subtilis]